MAQCTDCYDCVPGVIEPADGLSSNSTGGATSSSAPGGASPTLLRTINALSSCSADLQAQATEEDTAVTYGNIATGKLQEVETGAPFCRGRPHRREDPSSGSTSCATQDTSRPLLAGGGSSNDVDRLVARCMTHERPKALVQASPALLNACIVRLGEEAPAEEKRSDLIRRMLRLTDEIRRFNADLTEQAAASMEPSESSDE